MELQSRRKTETSVDNEDKVGYDKEEPLDNLVTWVYDLNNFNPSANVSLPQKLNKFYL